MWFFFWIIYVYVLVWHLKHFRYKNVNAFRQEFLYILISKIQNTFPWFIEQEHSHIFRILYKRFFLNFESSKYNWEICKHIKPNIKSQLFFSSALIICFSQKKDNYTSLQVTSHKLTAYIQKSIFMFELKWKFSGETIKGKLYFWQ